MTMTDTVDGPLEYEVTAPTALVLHNGDEIDFVAEGEMVTFQVGFTHTNSYMTLLRNTVGGAADSSRIGTLTHAGNTVAYTVDMSDADNGTIAFYDASQVNKSNSTDSNYTVTVDGVTVADNQYAAVGYVITVTPDAGYAVTSVTVNGTDIALESGSLNVAGDTITFKVPAAETSNIGIVVPTI